MAINLKFWVNYIDPLKKKKGISKLTQERAFIKKTKTKTKQLNIILSGNRWKAFP